MGGGGRGLCDDSTKALVIKRETMGGGGSKIVQNCVTSFMYERPLTVLRMLRGSQQMQKTSPTEMRR